jgi:hypothetical protein
MTKQNFITRICAEGPVDRLDTVQLVRLVDRTTLKGGGIKGVFRSQWKREKKDIKCFFLEIL